MEMKRKRRKAESNLFNTLDGDAKEVLASQISEAEFQNTLRTYARLKEWLYYHPYDSRRSDPGFPDTVLARDDRIIFAELKKMGGRISKPQRTWIDTLKEHPTVEVYIWFPSDWDQIEEVLA